ncbi:MAG: hypothetical protein ACRC6O_12475 [Flavobacterium sp.]
MKLNSSKSQSINRYFVSKKSVLVASLLCSIAWCAQGQSVSKNALGLRIGDNDGFGGEVSYQRKLAKNHRLELDLGWRNSNDVDAIKLAALYQWIWNIEGGFYWYAGVGGGVGSWNNDKQLGKDSGAFAFVAGDVGIEYDFDIPLQVALDFRPELYFNSDDFRDNNLGPDIALAVRYRF